MGTPNYTDAAVVIVRGDHSAHADQLFHRTVSDVADSLGVPHQERRSAVEHAAELSEAIIAASTPSMFTARRVVVLDVTLDAPAVKRLVAASSDAAVVVTRCSSRSNPKPSAGVVVVDARAPRSDTERSAALNAAIRRTGVNLDARARTALLDRVGADTASFDTTLLGLTNAASGSTVDYDTVVALVDLGASAAPFEFIDTLESGDIAGTLQRLQRLSGPSGWAPLRTLGLLRNRWVSSWRIAVGVAVPDTYANRHLKNLARRLGADRLAEGVAHIAAAEAAVKGGSQLDPDAVVEVCVARLARLAKTP